MKNLLWPVAVVLLLAVLVVCLMMFSDEIGLVAAGQGRTKVQYLEDVDRSWPELIPTSAPQPSATVSETTHDFGMMDILTDGEYSFYIENTGTGDLELKKGETTCECTISSLEEGGFVKPGERVAVKLAWKTKTGNVEDYRETAEIRTNDRGNRTIKFVIKGKVRDYLMVFPPIVAFPDTSIDTSPNETIVIASATKEQFKILDIESTSPHFAWKQSPASPESIRRLRDLSGYEDLEQVWELDLSLKEGMPLGRFFETITIHTNVENRETFPLKVHGRLTGSIEFFGPPQSFEQERWLVKMESVPKAIGKKVALNMFVRGYGKDIKPRVKSKYPEFLEVATQLVKSSDTFSQYRVEVSIPPGTPACNYIGSRTNEQGDPDVGRIILETDHPKEKELILLAAFVVRD